MDAVNAARPALPFRRPTWPSCPAARVQVKDSRTPDIRRSCPVIRLFLQVTLESAKLSTSLGSEVRAYWAYKGSVRYSLSQTTVRLMGAPLLPINVWGSRGAPGSRTIVECAIDRCERRGRTATSARAGPGESRRVLSRRWEGRTGRAIRAKLRGAQARCSPRPWWLAGLSCWSTLLPTRG